MLLTVTRKLSRLSRTVEFLNILCRAFMMTVKRHRIMTSLHVPRIYYVLMQMLFYTCLLADRQKVTVRCVGAHCILLAGLS